MTQNQPTNSDIIKAVSQLGTEFKKLGTKVDRLDTEIRHVGALTEVIADRQDALIEVVSNMQKHIRQIPIMREDITELKQGVKTIKSAVTATNLDLQTLGRRTPGWTPSNHA